MALGHLGHRFGPSHNGEEGGAMMLKKLLIATAAASILSVPLAALASADTASSNGVPGSNGGTTPGNFVSSVEPGLPPGANGLGAQHGFSFLGHEQGKP
jgi:hypothetical protein